MSASAQTVTANVGRTVNWADISETLPAPFNSTSPTLSINPSASYVTGNSANSTAVNQWWSEPITLASGANSIYTLTAMTDNLGRAVSFAGGVRLWGLVVTSRNAGDYLTIGAAASNPWTSPFSGTTPAIKVYDFFAMGVENTDKYAVANGSNEQVKVVNSGSNSISFQFTFVGCLT